MKSLTLIFLFPFLMNGQYKWFPKLTPEQDLTFDYYSNLALSCGSSMIINHYTHKPILAGFCGVGLGFVRSMFERGLDGKIVSNMGSVTGMFCYTIRNNERRNKARKFTDKKYVLD